MFISSERVFIVFKISDHNKNTVWYQIKFVMRVEHEINT